MFGFICGRGEKFWKVAGVNFFIFIFLAKFKLGHNISFKKKNLLRGGPWPPWTPSLINESMYM